MKDDIISDLKKLKNALENVENKIEDNSTYKPLDQNEINILEKSPSAQCIKKAFLYSISEKVKNIIEKYKLSPNFKTIIMKNKISISYVEDLYSFNVIKLDLSVEPPKLESIIYDNNLQKQKIKTLKQIIDKIKTNEYGLEDELVKEIKKLDEMNKENSIKTDYNPFSNNTLPIEIDKQKRKILALKKQISVMNNVIHHNTEWCFHREKDLEKFGNSINFIKLRKILENELGIDIDSDNKELEFEEKVYTFGKKYPIKYVRKVKKTN